MALESALAPSLAHSAGGATSPTRGVSEDGDGGGGAAPSSVAAAAQNTAPSAGAPFLAVSAHLARLAVHVSSRAAEVFWPPHDIAPAPSQRRAASAVPSLRAELEREEEVMLGAERPLIAIVAEGGLLSFSQAVGTYGLTLKLQRFVMEDCLVGPIDPALRYLARSFADAAVEPEPLPTVAPSPGSSVSRRASLRPPSARASAAGRSSLRGGGSRGLDAFASASEPGEGTLATSGGGAGGTNDNDDDDDEMMSACSDLGLSSRLGSSQLPDTPLLAPPAASDAVFSVMPFSEVVRFQSPSALCPGTRDPGKCGLG